MDYRKLQKEAYALRLAALEIERATQTTNDQALLIGYCRMVISHEKIRDIVAGMDRQPVPECWFHEPHRR